MAWYPKALKNVKGNSGGSYTGGPFRTVLHTTEGSSANGAISTFKKNNSWPHFLVDYAGTVWQFVDTNTAGRALRNLSGGVETNRRSAVQIEVVGFASKPNEWPAIQTNSVKELLRWIESTHGVKPKGPGRPFASAYGQNHLRFIGAEWNAFNGTCGHAHLPENDHWDPGAIDINKLLPDPGFQVPASYYTEVANVPFTLIRPQGGYIVVGGDGGVFTYDGAPFFGSVPGLGVTAKIVSAAYTPSGDGYWLLGSDGGVFSFGAAVYHGGFNAFPPDVQGNRKPIGIVAVGAGYRIITLDPSNDGSPFDAYGFNA